MTGNPRQNLRSGTGAACRIEAVLTIDSRGQLVIPKEVREKAHIGDGDKLALVSWEREGKTCCPALLHADALSPDVAGVLHAVLGGSGDDTD